jgi:hypothetical protein
MDRRLAERIDAYFDDDLSSAEIEQLEAELTANSGGLRQLASEAFFHQQLRHFLQDRPNPMVPASGKQDDAPSDIHL